MTGCASNAGTDRVVERRRAVAVVQHYRECERLSFRQIADRLGRSPATVIAYFVAAGAVAAERAEEMTSDPAPASSSLTGNPFPCRNPGNRPLYPRF